MPLNKTNRDRDPYEEAFAKARDIRLRRTHRPERPRIIITTSNENEKTSVKKLTH